MHETDSRTNFEIVYYNTCLIIFPRVIEVSSAGIVFIAGRTSLIESWILPKEIIAV